MKEAIYEYETPAATYKVYLETLKYANGRTCVVLKDQNHKQVAEATCNLADQELGPKEVFIRTWGGNEFMLQFLNKNHLVQDTGREIELGHLKARVVRLLIDFE